MSSLLYLYPLLLVAAIFLPLSIYMLFRRRVSLRMKVRCPVLNQQAQVTFLSRLKSHKLYPFRVKSCSLLPDPKHVDCGQGCLEGFCAGTSTHDHVSDKTRSRTSPSGRQHASV